MVHNLKVYVDSTGDYLGQYLNTVLWSDRWLYVVYYDNRGSVQMIEAKQVKLE